MVHDLEDLYIQEEQNAVFMCEVSLEDVVGEWYKDGHKIRPSSTVKIRTEGQTEREGGWWFKITSFIDRDQLHDVS